MALTHEKKDRYLYPLLRHLLVRIQQALLCAISSVGRALDF